MIHCYEVVSLFLFPSVDFPSPFSLLSSLSFLLSLLPFCLISRPPSFVALPPLSHCIQQILESVHHCHVNGIVHRDLKVCIGAAEGAALFRPDSTTDDKSVLIVLTFASFTICLFVFKYENKHGTEY